MNVDGRAPAASRSLSVSRGVRASTPKWGGVLLCGYLHLITVRFRRTQGVPPKCSCPSYVEFAPEQVSAAKGRVSVSVSGGQPRSASLLAECRLRARILTNASSSLLRPGDSQPNRRRASRISQPTTIELCSTRVRPLILRRVRRRSSFFLSRPRASPASRGTHGRESYAARRARARRQGPIRSRDVTSRAGPKLPDPQVSNPSFLSLLSRICRSARTTP
jgi:hypothetical protein